MAGRFHYHVPAVPPGGQPLDGTLTAVAGLAGAADRVPYFTGPDALALATLTAYGRAIIDDVDSAAARTTLELGNASQLTVGLNPENLMTVANITAFFALAGHNHDAAYQPLDGDLTAIAALAPANGAMIYRSGGAWVALAPGTEGQHLVADGAGLPTWQTP